MFRSANIRLHPTAGILPVKLGYQHPEGGSDPEGIGVPPAAGEPGVGQIRTYENNKVEGNFTLSRRVICHYVICWGFVLFWGLILVSCVRTAPPGKNINTQTSNGSKEPLSQQTPVKLPPTPKPSENIKITPAVISSTTTTATPTSMAVSTTSAKSTVKVAPTIETLELYFIEPGGIISDSLLTDPSACVNYGFSPYYFFWSEDSNYVLYELNYINECNPDISYGGWVSYDFITQLTRKMESYFEYDRSIWQKLGIEEPQDAVERGFISPSGDFVIYDVHYNITESFYGQVDIWLAKKDGTRMKLLEFGYPCRLGRAYWTLDEKDVVFDCGYEGPGYLYMANTQTGETKDLTELPEFQYGIVERWALSPDASIIALVSNDSLYFYHLENGQIDNVGEYSGNLQWSSDSQRVYYWFGSPMDAAYDGLSSIHMYDRTTSTISTIVAHSMLKKMAKIIGVDPSYSPFSISPDENKMIFTAKDQLWILSLK